MAKILIAYTSRGGTTRRYAEALARQTGGTALPLAKVTLRDLGEADTFVFGTWIMGGAMQHFSFVRRHWQLLKDKRLALMVVGLSPRLDTAAWERYTATLFLPEMADRLRVFYLRGGYDPSKVNFLQRKMMSMVCSSLKRKESPTPDDLEMIDAIEHGADHVKPEALASLAGYVEGWDDARR